MAGSSSGDFRVVDKDLGYKKLSKTLAEVGKTSSKAGILSDASKDVKMKAATNQFGDADAGIPPRPFLTQAWDNGGVDEYATLLMSSLDEYLETGDLSAVERGFLVTASIAAQDIEDSIRGGDFVENAPQTVALKGDNDPLIDTGELLGSIDFTVSEQKEPFKPADTEASIARSVLGPSSSSGSRRPKRPRKVGFRRKFGGGLSSLAKSPGYQGRGIRKRADRRPNAAEGVASRGTRRRGLRF